MGKRQKPGTRPDTDRAVATPNVRFVLTQRTIAQLPLAAHGQYFAFDETLGGFHVIVGRERKTFMVKADLRQEGKRVATLRVKLGDATAMTVSDARTIARGYLSEIRQGRHPKPEAVKRQSNVADIVEVQRPPWEINEEGPTLGQAWERYKAAMIKKGRGARTITGYEDHVIRLLRTWTNKPLKELAEDPDLVARKHDAITAKNGPYAANGVMRTLRAIYNHAWLKNKKALPRDNPVDAVDWNRERRRNTGMGAGDLPRWFEELARLDNPVRREFHLLTLLSGSRPTALKQARLEHLNLKRRVLHIPAPKGGEDRAFDIPLSREMIRSVMRLIRFGRLLHPMNARIWLFPAESEAGHMNVTQEDRGELSKWGNDLRQTYRTLATIAKVNSVDAMLLMNHAIPGVNEGYITREKIVEDHLRGQQQAIADVIFRPVHEMLGRNKAIHDWLAPRASQRQIAATTQTETAGTRLYAIRHAKKKQPIVG